jgi:hypothetical protein
VSDVSERIEQLLDEAEALEEGPLKADLLEEAVRAADRAQDVEAGYQARLAFMRAAALADRADRMVVAFTWCLAQSDRDPERFPQEQLLWNFKWVLPALEEGAQLPLERIEAVLAEMTRRYEKAGSTLRAVRGVQRDLAMHRGDRQAAAVFHRQMMRMPRDRLSDCPACERDSVVEYLLFQGCYTQAVDHAAPILAGYLSCSSVPQVTLAQVLVPMLRLGRLDEAADHHRRGYRMISRNPEYLRSWAHHLDFLTLTDNLTRGLRHLERHLADALASPSQTSQFAFFLSARLLLDRLVEQGQASLRLRLPAGFALHRPGGKYDTAELAGWFAARAVVLARRFDERNGTGYFARRISRHRELRKLARPYALTS